MHMEHTWKENKIFQKKNIQNNADKNIALYSHVLLFYFLKALLKL